jgi:transcriptional regulator with XRE-family HTH domain
MTVAEYLPLSRQLRQAIDGSGVSRYRLCKLVGMSAATMSRFMNGKGGLSVDMIDRIGRELGIRLVATKKLKSKER